MGWSMRISRTESAMQRPHKGTNTSGTRNAVREMGTMFSAK